MSIETNLSEQFKAFAGRAVGVVEKEQTYRGRVFTAVKLSANDPAVAELSAAVQAAGLQLRLWLPGMMGTMDYRLDRLNVHVNKDTDGTYRLGSSFALG